MFSGAKVAEFEDATLGVQQQVLRLDVPDIGNMFSICYQDIFALD